MVSLPTHLQCFVGRFFCCFFIRVSCLLSMWLSFVYWSLYWSKSPVEILWDLEEDIHLLLVTSWGQLSVRDLTKSKSKTWHLRTPPGCKSEWAVYSGDRALLESSFKLVLMGGSVQSFTHWGHILGCFLGNLPCDIAHTVTQFHDFLPIGKCPEDIRTLTARLLSLFSENSKTTFLSRLRRPHISWPWLLLPRWLTGNQPHLLRWPSHKSWPRLWNLWSLY